MKTRKKFWSKVLIAPGDACWEWMGGEDAQGYGKVRFLGQEKYTHRLVMEWQYERDLGRDEHVRHLCDNPGCVNPDHLRVGTAAENIADRDAKGRTARGPKRIPSETKDRIRARFREGASRLRLSREFGVAHATVARIVK